MDHFVPQPPHALLVPKKGGTSLRLIDRPSWVPVAWQGGDSFVVADWDSALPQSFYFAFKAVHATEWSLAIPPKCISSVQERLTNTAINGRVCTTGMCTVEDGDVIKAFPDEYPISFYLFLPTNAFLDDYEPGELLGKGTFGAVHTCHPRGIVGPTNLLMAVKIIRRNRFFREPDPGVSYSISVEREIAILRRLSPHKSILQIFATYPGPISSHIVTEYLADSDLLTKLEIASHEGVQLASADVRSWVRQICEAMEYIHSQRIVHRDLKAENAMLHDGRIKIIDFGVADVLPMDGRGLRGKIGTTLYMAPEVKADRPQYETVDCWSMGVLIQALFLGLPVVNRFRKHDLQSRLLAASVVDLIAHLFSEEPENRPPMFVVLEHAWLRQTKS